jgi:uncharacterized phage infection (PIP) family protein YhgE
MGEISSASSEQSAGVAQVGEAVTHMDQATQQNAALVEEMAAAASSLKSQAQELVDAVSTFKLGAQDHSKTSNNSGSTSAQKRRVIAPSKSATTGVAKSSPKATPQVASSAKASIQPPPALPKVASAGGDDEWETF